MPAAFYFACAMRVVGLLKRKALLFYSKTNLNGRILKPASLKYSKSPRPVSHTTFLYLFSDTIRFLSASFSILASRGASIQAKAKKFLVKNT